VLLFVLTVLRIGFALLYQREVAAGEKGMIDSQVLLHYGFMFYL